MGIVEEAEDENGCKVKAVQVAVEEQSLEGLQFVCESCGADCKLSIRKVFFGGANRVLSNTGFLAIVINRKPVSTPEGNNEGNLSIFT
ncbi:hypothetical protein JW796_03830 [Candidatus Dojkabacteria bacterium]|nr:hypothetical protein [Candidatus Dojkabacteria bacterium]